ncbi:casein kinase II beta chain [Plasmodium sp. gorilla clade G2]|uniref:casein kinase II beta chain n=1 Tax=Plasmodium sp. gorilla clade G2 TaxID=880535 RepID=UPI000D212693|nr:casein kinase II beta chain [Plasmodium sp. gorilla clade G2]SOV15297.1 casein kinase II beta chain [Plasmodium sp. gorilla clade G2]
MENSDSNKDLQDSKSDKSTSWVKWFNNRALSNFLVEVDNEYITDSFNLYGLKTEIPNFNHLISIIAGDAPEDDDDSKNSFSKDCICLYSLIHARFITTPKGLSLMKEKYIKGDFGTCPRVSCAQHNVLPIGLFDQMKIAKVHVYCPLCQEIYKIHEDEKVYLDGSFFGTSFPHILLQTYPYYATLKTPPYCSSKIFGFNVYQNFTRTEYKLAKGEFGRITRENFLKKNPKYFKKLRKEELQISET